MDTNIAHKIARAFVHGLAFAKGMTTLAQDAKAKMEEGDKWITIGAEPGDDGKKHGGRHVLISGTGEVKAGLSKSAQGKPLGEAVKELKDKAESKKAESKKAEKENLSYREMALRHKQEMATRASRSQEDIEAAHQLFLKFDRGAMRTMMDVGQITSPAQQRMGDIIRSEIPGANENVETSIKNSLRRIRSNIDAFNKTMGKIQSRIAKAISDGKIGEGRANAELGDYRRYYATFADYIARANKQMNNLDHTVNDGHREDREVLSKIANLTSELVQDATNWHEGQGPASTESKKAESKKAESKKAESKKSETKTKTKKSETPKAGLLTEQGSSLAQLAEREYDKVITAIKDDVSSIESDPTFPPEVKRYETVPIKSNLRNIKTKLSDVNKDLSTVKDEVSKAVKDGNFNRQGVESVWRAMKQLKDRAAYVVSHTNSETAWLGRNNTRGMTETAETLNRLSNEASGIRQDANRLKEEVRGSIAQFERENTESDRVDAMYAQKGGKPKNRIIN